MNDTKLFYSHEPDSNIMIKKDRAEVNNWTEDLEYINEELEYLLDIEKRMLNNQQLQDLQRENQLILGVLYKYESTIQKAIECDTIECDAFYLHKHEKTRNIYIEHVKKYKTAKLKVLSKILSTIKGK
ncbi:hypothetical protein [Maribacter sp. ACAM166]|uniref:hypothetical protein n=1 Tax=Maribacter sp. ACAM166 TaxID=2508996 RepID=UPI0010FE2058|nr:hypothetical protein [Maribacter sp. ACAM166]TLP82342.1 hypothetical protein ES765_02595 [Maribacter sp. ACAM166]